MGIDWGRVGKAKIFDKGSYLEPGRYTLKVLKAFTVETRDKGPALIVDFEVLESSNEDIQVGSVKNWYQSLSDKDIAFSEIKKFMKHLMHVSEADEDRWAEFEEQLPAIMEDVSQEKWRQQDAEDHPLNGEVIAVRCFHKKTRKDNDFTVHDWEYAEAEDDDEEDDD